MPTAGLSAIPVAVKDLFDTAGMRTTAGSLFFKDYVPANDAAVVSKLKQAGALIMGKTNTHEIALGITCVNPHFGACLNPWDDSRIAGGSSGGSAVAVAAGYGSSSLRDRHGRFDSNSCLLCGVVGLKPTYGRVSLKGVFPLSWNLDHAGTLTRCVEDAALMLQTIAGYDPGDPCSVDACRLMTSRQLSRMAYVVGGLRSAQESMSSKLRARYGKQSGWPRMSWQPRAPK